uniref:Proteoglycan 4a n=1 Tax=Neolamprologus brichardi TaxID=32507 RepID=A0A3Q4GHQ8_NEOBR
MTQVTFLLSSGSCVGRCGEVFNRGRQCKCDFSCLQHNECCQDFEATCTVAQSCQGRCGEVFRRGKLCECDPLCVLYNTCCHDYKLNCSKYPQPRLQLHRETSSKLHKNVCVRAGVFADVDLCSHSPINGLTALINGTILAFKGELFWSVDPISRSVGQPQSITDTLGISSPIDTIFTRANCQGNTYIIKGDQYWRLDGNMVMEPGYPKPLVSEFPGLTGHISAALAVPATRSKPETVYFFKNGEILQSFTFPPDSIPSCSKKPRNSMNTGVLLGGEINIKVSLKGFPTPITSALSMTSPQGSGGYHHYVFSGRKNNQSILFIHIKVWLRCP